ncbi:MAG TPA: NACHT domain-containing protein [Allosphingosinicella sp.]|jgi:hypothetical protein
MAISETAMVLAKTPAAANLFASVTQKVSRTLSGPARSAAVRVVSALEGYASYLQETNDRVSTVKTFANPALPVSLIDHFVTTKLRPPKKQDATQDQDDLIDRIVRRGRVVVSATAGHGKSMLMKYIALSLYENPRGRIPIFVELRHLNRVSKPDLITYINTSYKRTYNISEDVFRQGLSLGVFALLLDGFDELNHELRATIEEQILQAARTHPKVSIVVSGRPDDKFLSWRLFEVLKICPMTKPQVVELINKLEYDRGTKRRFIQKINKGLYESHESFLSTPLLAILMLLTYEENANIPDKMHLFYAKAFDTLFHKHDAMKEQYDRQRRSGLQIDDFEKVFSVFCLGTYVREKLEFTKAELLKSIKEAINYTGLEVHPENMLFDVEEAVCLLQKEGNSFFFVHRSFQEYFTALFLASCPEDIRDDFIEQVAVRSWDNVLSMLFDMAAAQLEPSWVVRNADAYLSYIEELGETDFNILLAKWVGLQFYETGETNEIYNFMYGPHHKFILVMRRFYGQRILVDNRIDFNELKKVWNEEQVDSEQRLMPGNLKLRNILFKPEHEKALERGGLLAFIRQEFEQIREIRQGIDQQQASRNKFLESLFSRQPSGSMDS